MEEIHELHEEGVIRFRAHHRPVPLDPQGHGAVAQPLISWRNRLHGAGLVGRDPKRYAGVGFGNLSGRLPPFPGLPGVRPFLITGTQTSGLPSVNLGDLCVVNQYDPKYNWVESFGLVRPSSESMTHGVLYDADPAIRYVFHGHSPVVWEQAWALDILVTDPAVDYGTPAMCREVERLLRDSAVARGRVLVMGGHRDGVLAFGETAEEAGQTLINLLSRAVSRGWREVER